VLLKTDHMVKNDKSRNKNEKKRFVRKKTQNVVVNVTVLTHVGLASLTRVCIINAVLKIVL
jgi:hypothetical protein